MIRATQVAVRLAVLMGLYAGVALAGDPPKGPFQIKSGIVEMTTDFMGDQKQTLYFDDYGRKQAVYTTTTVSMFGMTSTSHSATITADGKSIEIDVEKKTATRRSASVPASSMPDVAQLTEKMKKEYKLEPLEEREILGRKCQGFSMVVMGMPIKGWTWKGLPMLTMTRIGNGMATVKVVSIQEDVAVPPDKFAVPEGVQVKDI
jgi:hypothetical protein